MCSRSSWSSSSWQWRSQSWSLDWHLDTYLDTEASKRCSRYTLIFLTVSFRTCTVKRSQQNFQWHFTIIAFLSLVITFRTCVLCFSIRCLSSCLQVQKSMFYFDDERHTYRVHFCKKKDKNLLLTSSRLWQKRYINKLQYYSNAQLEDSGHSFDF